jgi:hypothetical protein
MENAELRIIALVKLDGTVGIVQFVFPILDVNMGPAMNRLNVTAIQDGLDLNVKELIALVVIMDSAIIQTNAAVSMAGRDLIALNA